MSAPATQDSTRRIALVGNPNCGKTTIFNRLTGLRQKVANYPGVTVERKYGRVRSEGRDVDVVDLPGTYSLSAHSPDERIVRDVLLGTIDPEERPHAVVIVIDASNLERNLYLLSQIVELELPVLVALNMVDVAERKGLKVDVEKLSEKLGLRVLPLESHRGVGVDDLSAALSDETAFALPKEKPELPSDWEALFETFATSSAGGKLHRVEVMRRFVDGAYDSITESSDALDRELAAFRSSHDADRSLIEIESEARYGWVRGILDGCLERVGEDRTVTERIDNVVTHPVSGLLIFLALMLVLFQSISSLADPLMTFVDETFGAIGEWVGSFLAEGILHSLVVDGIIGGVGGVVIFLPQILILFLFIGILEDCGYMSRAAFLMDRLMMKCGLSGKSFIPMLSGFACAIPGVMAARIIEDRRDRLATILVTPLMSCTARIPVYAILITTFIPEDRPVLGWFDLQGVTWFGMYLLGIVVAILVASLLKRTLLRGPTPAFVLELPPYRRPSIRTVAIRLFDRGVAFLKRAGTIILAMTIIIWALAYFPRSDEVVQQFAPQRDTLEASLAAAGTAAEQQQFQTQIDELDQQESGEYLRQSYLGRAGRTVAPVFAPLGWDWKISMATLASFPAREVVVSTLGTIYNLGDEASEESLGERLQGETLEDGKKVFTIPVALSIMVFFALCCQCGATVATIKRETNSWSWAWFTFTYMTVLAYIGAYLIYRVAGLFLS
ncbi:MAG: ferrous iron transport protein B [Planctomycetota bacterium]